MYQKTFKNVQKIYFFKKNIMQHFSAESIVFSKKIRKQNFAPENLLKPPSKVPHNWPPTFFLHWPGCPNGTETEILYQQKPLNAGLGI